MKSRKRTRNPENHKIFQQKSKVQGGLEYRTQSGKIVKAKTFYEQIECSCPKKCAQRIGKLRQKAIFETFFSLENRSKKILYLRSMIKSRPMRDSFNPVTIKKRKKNDYFLTDDSGHQQNVCFQFFTKCLQVSNAVIYNVIESAISNESAVESRGRISTKKNT